VWFDFGNQIAKMTVDPHLVETVLKLMSGIGVLRTRKMFGGVYIYCDDLFVATVHDNTLYFKANASTAAEYIERGLPQFTYPKGGGTATLQYFRAPPEVFSGGDAMRAWSSKALLAAKQGAKAKVRTSGRANSRGSAPSNAAKQRKRSDVGAV
jgi:DNA transformation protein